MHGDVIVLLFLALALICGVIVAILQTRMRADQRMYLVQKARSDRILLKLDAMLTAWAVYGDWNPACKAALLEAMALGDPPAPRVVPSALDTTTSMGMDFGLSLLAAKVWRTR